MSMRLPFTSLVLCLIDAGCSSGDTSTIDASPVDAAEGADAQAPDAPGGADASPADAGFIDSGVACPTPTGGPTNHVGATLTTSEIWSANDSPHILLGDYTVGRTGSLTIEPCAEVRIRNSNYLYVNGALRARGEPGRPIRIHANEAGMRFASIFIRTATVADLAWVEIEEGGALPNSTAGTTVIVEGVDWPPAPAINLEHVLIRGSAGKGIDLRGYARFADTSQDLTIEGSGAVESAHPYPMKITTNALGSIPEGRYTGNARDEIQIAGQSPHYQIEIDDAIHDRGVPYHVGGNGGFGQLVVHGGAGAAPTLTIDPGVELRFESTQASIGGMFVGGPVTDTVPSGRLIAVGTAAAPIILTSTFAVHGPGDWEGLTFTGPIDPGNQVEYVQIEYAGAHGGDSGYGCPPAGTPDSDGALKIFGEPSSVFITNCTIAHSSSHGIYRAWQGAEISFLAANTFIDIAACFEVEPKRPPPAAACPATPSCPR